MFISCSYTSDISLLRRQKLYISHYSGIIKCLSLKPWDINSLVYMNYIFFICIKKQYTSFFFPEYFNVIYDKPKIAVKTNFINCDHQYYINFIKLRNILWPLGSFPFQRELCLGPGTIQRFVSVKTEALDQPLMEAIYRVKYDRTYKSSFYFSDTSSLTR